MSETPAWSKNHKRCLKCGTTEIRHKGHGLCRTCWSAARLQDPQERERHNQACKRYQMRNPQKVTEMTQGWRRRNAERTNALTKGHKARYAEENGHTYSCRYKPGSSVAHPIAGRVTILGKAFRDRGRWCLSVRNRHGEILKIQTKELKSPAGATL